jgi:hypothetical protein
MIGSAMITGIPFNPGKPLSVVILSLRSFFSFFFFHIPKYTSFSTDHQMVSDTCDIRYYCQQGKDQSIVKIEILFPESPVVDLNRILQLKDIRAL